MRNERSIAPRRARPVLGQPTYLAPRYHSRTWGRLIFAGLILLVCGVFGGAGGLYWSLNKAQGSSTRAITFHVNNGDTVTSVANRLQRDGLIGSALLFRLDARLQRLAGKLRAGNYTLRPDMSIGGMIGALQIYRNLNIAITIPEGLRKEQIAQILRRHGISGAQFLREVNHPDFTLPILAGKPKGHSLEGYLYPNTYYVPPHYSGKLFAEMMVRTLGEVFTPAMRQLATHNGMGTYGVLKLASIVEREAREPAERPLIASVYLNRLKTPSKILNADPTVQYAMGKPGNWWPRLTSGQEDASSPFNSYTHAGLPPTPICNPGLASIQAAVTPANTTFMYFVAKGNGYHAFARTLAGQDANIQKYGQHG